MPRAIVFFLVVFVASFAQSQIYSTLGVRQNGLGNASLNISDIWSVKNNPGAFAFFEGKQACLVYQNRFMVSELATQSMAFGFETGNGNIGFNLNHTGFNLFRTLQFGGSYALALSPKLGMGVNFNYQQTRFGDIYGVKHHFAAGLGLQYKLNKNVFISGAVQNINRSKVSLDENERLPTFFGLGLSYQISDNILWLIDVEKEVTSSVNVRSGLELKAHEYFDVRFGFNSFPFQSSFGFGTHIKDLQIDFAATWHSQLGLAPSFGVNYRF